MHLLDKCNANVPKFGSFEMAISGLKVSARFLDEGNYTKMEKTNIRSKSTNPSKNRSNSQFAKMQKRIHLPSVQIVDLNPGSS
jgi:hypothetical protein